MDALDHAIIGILNAHIRKRVIDMPGSHGPRKGRKPRKPKK